MAKQIYYYQCELKKIIDHRTKYTVAWIPGKYTTRGNILSIKNEEGVWENGWEVISLGAVKKETDILQDERGYLKQREKSDV